MAGGDGGHRASEVMYLSSQVWSVFSLVLGLVWREASFSSSLGVELRNWQLGNLPHQVLLKGGETQSEFMQETGNSQV